MNNDKPQYIYIPPTLINYTEPKPKHDSVSYVSCKSSAGRYLVYKHYLFYLRKRRHNVSYWMCKNAKQKRDNNSKCPGKVILNKLGEVKSATDHDHDDDFFEIEALKCIEDMKRRVLEEPTISITKIYREEIAKQVPSSHLPTYIQIKSRLYKLRTTIQSSKQPVDETVFGKQTINGSETANFPLDDQQHCVLARNRIFSMQKNPKAKELCVQIQDDYKGYNLNLFCIPKFYKGALDCVLVPCGVIKDRIKKVAQDIFEDIGKEPIFAVCILNGGYTFFNDLFDQINNYSQDASGNTILLSVDFIKIKNTQEFRQDGLSQMNNAQDPHRLSENGYTKSSLTQNQIFGIGDFNKFTGKNILIVQDIIDACKVREFLKFIMSYNIKSAKIASLLVKRTEENFYYPDYCCFEVPNVSVVGYTMDYNEYFRDLEHICILNEYGRKKFGLLSETPKVVT